MTKGKALINDHDTLSRLLSNTKVLLLDFDGPICSVFSGLTAATVADQLRYVLQEGGYENLPIEIERAEDPFEVFKYSSTLGSKEAQYVEAALRAHEVEAVASAEPTVGAHDLIRFWGSSSRTLAIVSNNSRIAVENYLYIHKLTPFVQKISGRTSSDPELLKPSTHLIDEISDIGSSRNLFTLIGDSVSDVEAALKAQVNIIGYANKPGKHETLFNAGSTSIVTSMEILKISAIDSQF